MNDTLLRPRSPIEIIDAAFSLYRANFAVLVAIALILLGPFEIAGAVIPGPVGVLVSNLSGLLGPIVIGATVAVISDVMHARPVSLASAFGQISGRWGMLITVSLAQSILVILAFFLLIVPGIVVACWTFAAPMAVVVEHISGVSGAIGRARELARGQFWHILKTLLLAWIIFLVLLVAVGTGVGLAAAGIGLSDGMTAFLSSWAFILLIPIVGTASSVLYFDLRVRTEAYDIQFLAESITIPAPPAGASG